LCDAGQYGSKKGFCVDCPDGFYQDAKGEYECKQCELGELYVTAKTRCTPCDAGKYGSAKGNCSDCSSGKFTGAKGQSKCEVCTNGQVVGRTTCAPCGLGKHGHAVGCISCESGKFQDTVGRGQCEYCGDPRERPNNKSTACEKPNYPVKEDCKSDSEYFDNTSTNLMEHVCEGCPEGAFCIAAEGKVRNLRDVKPLTGYWRVPWKKEQDSGVSLTFKQCFEKTACLGADQANSSDTTEGCGKIDLLLKYCLFLFFFRISLTRLFLVVFVLV
jgi:hypothetical protein